MHIPEYDGWRGLAILSLLAGHFLHLPGLNLGEVGVNLFFVLSGLLMARVLFEDSMPLGTFYRRRIARIVPALAVFVVLVVAASALLAMPVVWSEVIPAATFTTNYFPGPPGHALMPLGHIWSLSVEEHSYVVLSLIALLASIGAAAPRRALVLLCLASCAAGGYYVASYHGAHLQHERWLRTEVAAFGILASALVRLHRPRLRFLRGWPVSALLAGGILLHWWSLPLPVHTFAGVALLALAVNHIEHAPAALRAVFSNRALMQMGLWSYSIYLWQQPFYYHLDRHAGLPLLPVAGAVAAGVASFYLIEQPARRFLNSRGRAPPSAAPPAPSALA